MLKNYIKIAWRNLWNHKGFSLINIFGLAVGIVFTMLVGAYVWGDLQMNRHLKNADNQYIILSNWKNPNMGLEFTSIAALAPALKDNYPGLVANYYNATPAFSNVSAGEKRFREGLQTGDSTLLTMYGFKLLYGDASSALKDPLTVVITSQTAEKYFGKLNVIGRALTIEDFSGHKKDFRITGVLDRLPPNTVTKIYEYHDIDLYIHSFSANYFQRNTEGWGNGITVSHLELQNGASPAAVEAAIRHLLKENASEDINQNLTAYLMPLKSWYLRANNGLIEKMIWTLSGIALFILLMAIVNFVNICVARSSGRMKEIGVRKVMGGMRKQLAGQFLIESILVVCMATLFAMLMYLVASPYFGQLLGTRITPLFDFPFYFLIYPVLFSLLVGVLAGIYPALVLSALKSVEAFKGRLAAVKENVLFRQVLVSFQFATAAVVFIGAIIIAQQVNLFFSSNLGYNKDYIVYAQVPRNWTRKGEQKMEAIRYRFARLPQLSHVSLSWEIPANIDWSGGGPVYREGANPLQAINSQHLTDDNEYAATYGIPVRAGTFFKPIVTEDDSSQAVINESESKALGWKTPDEAIGRRIVFQGDILNITGVVADFHFGSMQARIQPMVFTNVNYSNSYRYLSFKLTDGDIQKNLAVLQAKWKELLPGEPFAWSFMDDALKKVYTTEIRLKKAANIAAALAVVIVLLGVLGLVSLSIQKRTKEIGIRKILGAPVAGIISLFLKDFLSIVLVACVIACPLAWLLMNKWLSDYAYRVSISLVPFIVSLVVLIFITTVLIVVQTTKAALANPVKSLRSE
jgi:putative ABC transport system permease protein